MVQYAQTLDGVRPEHLIGFFAGWPSPPSPETHLRILRQSSHVVLAREPSGRVVGFITAISDGVLSAFVSLLEVLPSHQRTGIGTALVRHLLVQLEGLYSISLHCDAGLRSFYERLGLKPLSGMAIRDYSMQAVGTQPDKESREGRALAVDAIAGRVAARDRGLLRRGDALG